MLYRRGVITAVRNHGNALFAATNPVDKLEKAKELAAEVCRIYGRPVPAISLRVSNSFVNRGQCSDTGIVLFNNVSLTTLLHELYHWLCLGTTEGSDEQLARQWSCMLFIRALPRKAFHCIIPVGGIKYSRSECPARRLRRVLPAREPQPAEAAAPAAQ